MNEQVIGSEDDRGLRFGRVPGSSTLRSSGSAGVPPLLVRCRQKSRRKEGGTPVLGYTCSYATAGSGTLDKNSYAGKTKT